VNWKGRSLKACAHSAFIDTGSDKSESTQSGLSISKPNELNESFRILKVDCLLTLFMQSVQHASTRIIHSWHYRLSKI